MRSERTALPLGYGAINKRYYYLISYHKKIQQLFDCIIKEIFIFSNFNMFNVEEDLETYSVPIIEKDKIVSINSGIRNVKEKPLCIVYKFK